jgi:hypothetical protein
MVVAQMAPQSSPRDFTEEISSPGKSQPCDLEICKGVSIYINTLT